MSRSHRVAGWLLLAIQLASSTALLQAEEAVLVIDGPLGFPASLVLPELTHLMKNSGLKVRHAKALSDAPLQLVIGTPQQSRLIADWERSGKIDLPKPAESLCVARVAVGDQRLIVIAGRDERGLSYAIRDLISHSIGGGKDWLNTYADRRESPFSAHRSVAIHLFNRDLESEWYYDEDYWEDFFSMLANCRFNAFSLTFADHTNYLNPPYPFLVDVPEYPHVKVSEKSFTPADQARNLQMLKTISDLSAHHGLTFIFSVWMQKSGFKRERLGESQVDGIPEAIAGHADYCAQGLAAVLKACPNIGGVQFRMNDESGVPEDLQTQFYRRQFEAIAACGRPIQLDLRFKGLRPETIAAAVDLKLDVNVSTKFWTEHTGLPFHATESDPRHRWGRYGYADMLYKPRRYQTFFRLWSGGTQRLLSWGDPEYAARFARSCSLSDSRGFEIFAMPANKGYGNQPGQWPILIDEAYLMGPWEFERYWAFYLAYGRAGYSPDGWQEAWNRELKIRFGDAGEAIGRAYQSASGVLPLLNAARLDSASEFNAWAEMSPGKPLDEYATVIPSDTGLFYGIRRGKPGGEFTYDGPGYVDAVVRGELRAKWTPFDVAQRLDVLANRTENALDAAKSAGIEQDYADWKSTELDLMILADLARYHAGKMRAATHAELFKETKQPARLVLALNSMKSAADAWRKIIARTDGVYYDKLRMLNVDGHWKDRLPAVEDDLRRLEKAVAEYSVVDKSLEALPGEEPLVNPPVIEHQPITQTRSDRDLTIRVKVTSARPLKRVVLLHRPVNQRVDWQEIGMKALGDDLYEASISHKDITARFDHLYRIEALLKSGGGTLWPDWQQREPFVVVTVNNEE